MIFLTERVNKAWDWEMVRSLAVLDRCRLRQGARCATGRIRWKRARVVQFLVAFEGWGCWVCLN